MPSFVLDLQILRGRWSRERVDLVVDGDERREEELSRTVGPRRQDVVVDDGRPSWSAW